MFKFRLGDKVKDLVTPFEGIVIARTEHLNGCIRYGVQNQKLKDGNPTEPQWYDEKQLALVKGKAVDVDKKRTGGPAPTPRGLPSPK